MSDTDESRIEQDGTDVAQRSSAAPLRLFVIPLLIVLALVFVWLFIRLPGTQDLDPQQLVQDIGKLDDSSWLKAYALSQLLAESNDDAVAHDRILCRKVANLLDAELAAPIAGEERTQLGVFLCRALGEFRVADGLPVLCRAAAPNKDTPSEVRCAALEALAVQGDHLGYDRIASFADVMRVLLASSVARDVDSAVANSPAVRSRAAFALGVLGGPRALNRLAEMLADPDADARCNAATGLARQGDQRALPVLLEMLDPANSSFVANETEPAARNTKRVLVMINAIRAATKLVEQNCPPDTDRLRNALRRITTTDQLPGRIRIAAREALIVIESDAVQRLG